MEKFIHRSWAEIDLDQICANYEHIRKLIPNSTKIMAVLKADAYGYGDVDCAKALNVYADDWYAVASINEALHIRSVSNKPTLILTYTDPKFTDILIKEDLTQTVVSLDYAKELSERARMLNMPVDVHIKLDTGMNRIGIIAYEEHAAEAISQCEEILNDPWLHVTGIFTHITTTYEYAQDDKMREFADKQFEAFKKVTDELINKKYDVGLRHACNSGGIINVPKLSSLDMVRVGCLLYGIYPRRCMEHFESFPNAMCVKSSVLHVKHVEKGQYFSYSMTGFSDKPLKVATVSIGYGDGFRRCLGNIGRVLIGGSSCRILGRVCMDQIIVDVSDVKNVSVGDEVIVLGRQGSEEILIDELCRLAQTGPPEISCLLTGRVQKIYIENGKPGYRVSYTRNVEDISKDPSDDIKKID